MNDARHDTRNGSTRREFLAASGTAAAALLAAPTLIQAAGEARIHANRGKIYKADKGAGIGRNKAEMVETLRRYKAAGFDGLEGGSPDITDIEALKEAIREVDFPVSGLVDGVHWKQRLSDPDPAIREIGRAALEKSLHDASALGASSVLLVPGKVTGDAENHDHVWQRSIVEIRKVLPIASKLGIRILIENVGNGFCVTPEETRDYIDEIASPWVGVHYDIGNHLRLGPAEHWIRTLGTRIVKLDMKDWKDGKMCRLGEGVANWPEIRKALAEIQFTGWATREGKDKSIEDTSELMDELLDL